ncbi:MAG: hypothetical protein ACH346_05080, partial [Chthoniobacterales bacterium]
MKKTSAILLGLVALFKHCSLIAAIASSFYSQPPSQEVTKYQVTASDYCEFLNQVATVSDSHHFYEEKMGHDPLVACITRVGAPGRWHYDVVAGRENYPIHYVSELAQASYADRLQAVISCADRLKVKGYRLEEEASETGKLERINGEISSSTTSTSTSN